MNISGFPLLVKLTNLPAGSPSAGTDQEEVSIQENVVSSVIWQRWIACYMLQDWNLFDAQFAYVETECIRIQEVCRRLEGTTIDARSLEGTLTDTFNHVLLEDVEYSIQRYMEAWKCDRSMVEFWIAWVIAELFSCKSSDRKVTWKYGYFTEEFYIIPKTQAVLPACGHRKRKEGMADEHFRCSPTGRTIKSFCQQHTNRNSLGKHHHP